MGLIETPSAANKGRSKSQYNKEGGVGGGNLGKEGKGCKFLSCGKNKASGKVKALKYFGQSRVEGG